MYGSEVWGIYDKHDYNSYENDIIEKTQIQFCKQVLGVNINSVQMLHAEMNLDDYHWRK